MFNLIPTQVKIIGAIVFSLVLVYSGWKAHSVYTDHKILKLIEQAEENRKLQEASDRLLIKSLQTNQETLQRSYIALGKELDNAKGKLGKCRSDGSITISSYGVRLWDNIGKGTLPEDSTRVVEESTTTSSSLEKLYENYRVNSEICNGMREQLRNIILWDEKTFGGKK